MNFIYETVEIWEKFDASFEYLSSIKIGKFMSLSKAEYRLLRCYPISSKHLKFKEHVKLKALTLTLTLKLILSCYSRMYKFNHTAERFNWE